MNWPESLASFESFLKEQGLSCEFRGTVPRYGERLVLYNNNTIAIRVLSEKSVWFAEVSDLARPSEWYEADIIRQFVGSRDIWPMDQPIPITEQLKIIRDHWSTIIKAFDPGAAGNSHR